MSNEQISAETGLHIMRLLEGDRRTEEQIVHFLRTKYGAQTVLDIPAKVAAEIIRRPADFVRAAQEFWEPGLPF